MSKTNENPEVNGVDNNEDGKVKGFFKKTIDNIKAHPVTTITIVVGTVAGIGFGTYILKNGFNNTDIPVGIDDSINVIEDITNEVSDVVA